MTYDHLVNAALILAGIVIGWMTLNEFQRLMRTGWYRKPKRCTVRKVWDSEEPKDV